MHGIRAIILHSMSHLSIEVTPKRHQRLKAIAALSGKTIVESPLCFTCAVDNEMDVYMLMLADWHAWHRPS